MGFNQIDHLPQHRARSPYPVPPTGQQTKEPPRLWAKPSKRRHWEHGEIVQFRPSHTRFRVTTDDPPLRTCRKEHPGAVVGIDSGAERDHIACREPDEALRTNPQLKMHPQRPAITARRRNRLDLSSRVDDHHLSTCPEHPGGERPREGWGRPPNNSLRDPNPRGCLRGTCGVSDAHGLDATVNGVPDPVLTGASDLPPAGWTGRERLIITVLLVALVGAALVRADTRRPDSSRNPTDLDVLIIHAGGLGASAAALGELANDLDFDPIDMQLWSNAFAQSTDPTRSARCLLDGDLVRDMGEELSPESLPIRLQSRGWRTILVDDGGSLARDIGGSFDVATPVLQASEAAPALAAWWSDRGADDPPRFAFVQLGFGHEPLHSDTTEDHVLQERYKLRVKRIRETVRAVAAAARADERGQLVLLMGASGIETGEHPGAPNLPWDAQLRVPLLMGLRWADGLPPGDLQPQVQSADVAPTILDLLDLRTANERHADGTERVGRSLEPHLHGWRQGAVHEALVFFGVDHVAVRSPEWKLIVPIERPLRPLQEGAQLYALTEDPGEQRDLLSDNSFGPVADGLFAMLADRFGEAPRPSARPNGTAQAPSETPR